MFFTSNSNSKPTKQLTYIPLNLYCLLLSPLPAPAWTMADQAGNSSSSCLARSSILTTVCLNIPQTTRTQYRLPPRPPLSRTTWTGSGSPAEWCHWWSSRASCWTSSSPGPSTNPSSAGGCGLGCGSFGLGCT